MSVYSVINTGVNNDATRLSTVSSRIYGVDCMNNNSSVAYLKFYDTPLIPAWATMTPIRRYMIPANGGIVRLFTAGLQFTHGLGFTIVSGILDTDHSDVVANSVLINIDWGDS